MCVGAVQCVPVFRTLCEKPSFIITAKFTPKSALGEEPKTGRSSVPLLYEVNQISYMRDHVSNDENQTDLHCSSSISDYFSLKAMLIELLIGVTLHRSTGFMCFGGKSSPDEDGAGKGQSHQNV